MSLIFGKASKAQEEGKLLNRAIEEHFPNVVNGRDAILEMKDGGSNNWRQMEWIGFYPEYWFEKTLARSLRCTAGPTFGKVQFDLKRDFVWDQKSHVEKGIGKSSWAPLNDSEAIEDCIIKHAGIGFLVISGAAVYDEDESFRNWHVALSGGESDYSKKNRSSGAPRRRRKEKFIPRRFVVFRFESLAELQLARSDGWVKGFQKGMRNSGGTSRRAKVQVDLANIPEEFIVSDLRR